MEPLTWTGGLGSVLDPILYLVSIALAVSVVAQIVLGLFAAEQRISVNADGTIAAATGPYAMATRLSKLLVMALVAVLLIYLVGGALLGPKGAGIIGGMSRQLIPVWIALIVLYSVSIVQKRKLGLYGKLFDNTVGMIGFGLVMFWVFVAIFGAFDVIVTHDPLGQVSGMKNKVPGTPMRGAEDGEYAWFLLGGDNLARDIFSRIVTGSGIVVLIAPFATLFAFMVGITLGLPAGYYSGAAITKGTMGSFVVAGVMAVVALITLVFGGFSSFLILAIFLGVLFVLLHRTTLDTVLSFLANLILAFPVILLFYLLVTPEIVLAGVPNFMAMVLFSFPVIFFAVLLNSRYHTQPAVRTPLLLGVVGVLLWIYLALTSSDGYFVKTDTYAIWGLPSFLDWINMPPEILVVFVSVVFVNSPTVFRIVRGLALDIKTRDYVAAAQTRGEGPWYIMLWEILPNARGPLIVDFCLRIGYTTILLGTLGFFGLGLESESPDWGTTINAGRKLLSVYPHAALAPALSLLSLVLGLNLLADGLREESLKD